MLLLLSLAYHVFLLTIGRGLVGAEKWLMALAIGTNFENGRMDSAFISPNGMGIDLGDGMFQEEEHSMNGRHVRRRGED